jgi:hypothetical protein
MTIISCLDVEQWVWMGVEKAKWEEQKVLVFSGLDGATSYISRRLDSAYFDSVAQDNQVYLRLRCPLQLTYGVRTDMQCQ